jgi:hypothetical protein
MIVKGIPKSRIAIEFGMSYDGLTRITYQPEYLKIEEEVRRTMRQKMDARLEQRAKMEDEVDDALPEAMQVLIDGVRKKKDLRAALELLDRDPMRQFAKGSKSTTGQGAPPPTLPEDSLRSAVQASETAREQLSRNANTVSIPSNNSVPVPPGNPTQGGYDA